MRKRGIILCFSFFIFNFSFAQSWLWGQFGKGTGLTYSVASDNVGNCFLAGVLPIDTITFGNITLKNSSSYFEAYIVKFDKTGNIIWAKQTVNKNSSGIGFNFYSIAAIDNRNHVYLNTNFSDTVFIGSDTLINKIGYSNTCLIKYDEAGNQIWVVRSNCITDTGGVASSWVSSDKSGNIFVSGVFSDSVIFGANTLVNFLQYPVSFIAKYDSSGSVKWAKQSNGLSMNSNDVSYSNTADKFGNSFLTGAFVDTVSFGSFQLTDNNTINFYLTKYDSSGNVKWAKQAIVTNSNGEAVGWSLTTDQTGNIYALGDVIGTAIFDNDTVIAPNDYIYQNTFFLIKYDPNGNILWLKTPIVLDSNSWQGWSLSSDNSNHIYLSANGGYGNCKISFGGDTLNYFDTSKIDGASVIFMLDSNGKALCTSIIPAGTIEGNPNEISSDTSGKYVYFAAGAGTTVVFGNDTINPSAFPINVSEDGNYFPFVARWQACDTNIFSSVPQTNIASEQAVVYPNPNAGTFTIALKNVNENTQVRIYNVLGEEVYYAKLNSGGTQINLIGQAEGVYFYRVLKESGGVIGDGKIVIEK